MRERERNRGQGWGVIAQRMGIKPGSAEFHALKGHLGKSKARYESHGGRGPGHSGKGAPRLDDDGPGNSGKGNSGKAEKGNSGKAEKGNSGKGKGNGKP